MVGSGTAIDNQRHVYKCFHVVDHCRLAPETRFGGKRRFLPRFADFTLGRTDQSSLFAADKSPGALADLNFKVKARTEDVLSQKPQLTGLSHSLLDFKNSSGILNTDIDYSFSRSHRVGGDHHALQHRMGVALQQAPVHKGARVSLVGIAEDILFISSRGTAEFPFKTRHKAGSPPATQPGVFHFGDYRLGSHPPKNFGHGGITAVGNIIENIKGIDMPDRFQKNPGLQFIEGDIISAGDFTAIVRIRI